MSVGRDLDMDTEIAFATNLLATHANLKSRAQDIVLFPKVATEIEKAICSVTAYIVITSVVRCEKTIHEKYLSIPECAVIVAFGNLILANLGVLFSKSRHKIDIAQMNVDTHFAVFATFEEKYAAQVIVEGNKLFTELVKSQHPTLVEWRENLEKTLIGFISSKGEEATLPCGEKIDFDYIFGALLQSLLLTIE